MESEALPDRIDRLIETTEDRDSLHTLRLCKIHIRSASDRIAELEEDAHKWQTYTMLRDMAHAAERIVELDGLCREWARWVAGFQHLGETGRDLLRRTHKSIRGEAQSDDDT